jgi:uncharacterized protein (DUF1800 family)
MALFWHNHFATGYGKISGAVGGTDATRMMAARPSEDPGGAKGQIELFRQYALGNFRDLLVQVAQDPAMLVWLDGRTNVRTRPQENFARELMELFTFGVGHYTEQDVYAGARVFTGWNLQRSGQRDTPAYYYGFLYNAAQHDTDAKDFSFPIYPDGTAAFRRVPPRRDAGWPRSIEPSRGIRRRAAAGAQAVGVSSARCRGPTDRCQDVAGTYYRTGYDMRAVVRRVLTSPEFYDQTNEFTATPGRPSSSSGR